MKYHSKYHSIIDFKGILQIENELKYDLNKININILKTFMGIRLDEDSNEDTDTKEISNYDLDEIISILPEKIFLIVNNYLKMN